MLGLTNYSHWKEAANIRSCSQSSVTVRAALLSVALARLRTMAHVGVMEELQLSIASLAVTRSMLFTHSIYMWHLISSRPRSMHTQIQSRPVDISVCLDCSTSFERLAEAAFTSQATLKFPLNETSWQAVAANAFSYEVRVICELTLCFCKNCVL